MFELTYRTEKNYMKKETKINRPEKKLAPGR